MLIEKYKCPVKLLPKQYVCTISHNLQEQTSLGLLNGLTSRKDMALLREMTQIMTCLSIGNKPPNQT